MDSRAPIKDLRFIHLLQEVKLNKVLDHQKQEKNKIRILFTSLWDSHCQVLHSKLNEKRGAEPLFVVDSFNMAHSFVIFRITKAPTLVTLNGDKVYVETYLPRIYTELGI